MQEMSSQLTRKRFGNTMQMYVPMYLSNECHNVCTYCGFSFGNKVARLTLTEEQVVAEAQAIRALGFEHVLLVTGESQADVGIDYLERMLRILRPHFAQITMEVQPLDEEEYARLVRAGLYAVLVYQETYCRETYARYHLKGKKRNFDFRLETPDRLGRAGIRKIGLGSLIGLSDFRTDAFFVALHLQYLSRIYWRSKFSLSFPRLRPAEGVSDEYQQLSDNQLRQLICAYRLFDENVELSLSTREPQELRDSLVPFGITSMSAGSRTEPGGYAAHSRALKQFEISDERAPAEIVGVLRSQGFEPVWKDWEVYW